MLKRRLMNSSDFDEISVLFSKFMKKPNDVMTERRSVVNEWMVALLAGSQWPLMPALVKTGEFLTMGSMWWP